MTSKTSDLTKITVLVANEIHDVPVEKLAKKLGRKFGLKVIEVCAERG